MKQYRIIYSFNHRTMGFNNSITVNAENVDKALKEAERKVAQTFGAGQMKWFSFKPDPVYSGIVTR
jgi:hypothetical protein